MEPIAGVSFSPARLGVIAGAGERHFWHAPRRELILQLLAETGAKDNGPLLDVGCGAGSLVRTLLQLGYDAQGLDPFAETSGLAKPTFVAGTLKHLPWEEASFETLCAFDVIEHVAEEDAALLEMKRVLRPGGRVLISVPAYQALWGPRDDAAGHLRRYSRRTLRAVLTRNGLILEQMFGFQLVLLPMLFVSRWTARRRGREETLEDKPGALLNTLLRAVNTAEVRLGRLLRPATGSSLFVVARKQGGG